MKTSILNKVLVVIMLFVCHSALAHDFEVNGIYYGISIFNKNTAYVTHRGTGYNDYKEYSGSVVIPESVTYKGKSYTVASIGGYAFYGCDELTSVTIPATVNTINQNAFNGCTGLMDIECRATTPPALGDNAFSSYNALLIVPESSESTYKSTIGWKNFNYPVHVGDVVSVSGVTYKVISTTEVEVVAGTANYTGNIVIPSEITIYGNKYTVSRIGDLAFYDCKGLENVTIPNSVTTIGSVAFSGCTGLTSVTIPNSVTTIGSSAFSGCTGLTSVTISATITSIEDNAFNGCTGLTSVTSLNQDPPRCRTDVFKYVSIKNIPLFVPNESINLYKATEVWKDFTNIVGFNPIISELYYNIISDTEVEVIAGETQYTGDIVIPNEVTLEGKKYNVTSIGENAFKGCTGMTSVSIPNSITNVGVYAFDLCTGLTAVFITDIEAWCNIDFAIGTSNPLYYAHNLVLNKELLKNLEIPNTITKIKSYTFDRCYSINSVTISNSVTSIGDFAFYGCNKLKSVIISDSVITICDYAFADCYNVTNVEIGNSVTVIGNAAFGGCSSLTSIVIPNSVTEIMAEAFSACDLITLTIPEQVSLIGNYAFMRCQNLEIVEFNAENCFFGAEPFAKCPINHTVIGERVKNISRFYEFRNTNKLEFNAENYTGGIDFSDFKYLNTVIIGKNVTNIPFYSISPDNIVSINVDPENTLYDSRDNCNAIIETATNTLITGCKTTIIPNSVTTIGIEAFSSCTGLISITIPNSVTSIGTWSFHGCTGLTSVTSLNPTPPACDADVFLNVNTQNITLTVPEVSVSAYKSADTWKDFGTITGISGGQEINIGDVVEYEGLTYKVISDTEVEVIAGESKYTGDVIIPSQIAIDGRTYIVTTIGENAFYDCSDLTSVKIPVSVISIGSSAFQLCTGLINVTIGNSVTSIGGSAFTYCTRLTSVTIPNSVTSIRDFAFSYCKRLTSVTIPNSVTSIEAGIFSNCTGLTSVTIPNTVTYIESLAFSDCTSLTSIIIPEGVTSIGSRAFNGCTGLTSIMIGNSVTSIESGAFENTGWYNNQPNGILYLDKCCLGYKGEEPIGTLALNDDTRLIADYAFFNCSKLTNITIPNSVTSIGYVAFYGCTGLTSVTSLNPTPPTCGTGVFGNVNTQNIPLTVPSESVELYQVADTWKDFGTIVAIEDEIEGSLLNYNIISDTEVEVIAGDTKYEGDIVIPRVVTIDGKKYTVTSIGNRAFDACTGLTSIIIPNTVTNIGNYAYRECDKLASITVGNSVNNIGYAAFYKCTGLTTVYITDLEAWCKIDLEEKSANPVYYAKNLYLNDEKVTNLVIPNTITEIKGFAFYGCKCITSVNIPNSVTNIGEEAFYGCTGLTSVTIPNSVTSIGDSAFHNCTGLTSIVVESGNIVYDSRENCNAIIETATNTLILGCNSTVIPNSVTNIGEYAFSNTGLTSVTIPNSVTSIGEYAFSDCTGLTNISIPNSVKSIGIGAFIRCIGLTSITISNSITSIELMAFGGCTGLTSVNIPNSVTSIGDWAFSNTGLTSVTIPNSVTSIGEYAFSGCTGLTNISIPNSVKSIGSGAFANCIGLTNIVIPNSITSIEHYVFEGCKSLNSVEIPNFVTSIGWCAFNGCSDLTSIVIPNSVTSINNKAFLDCTGLTNVVIGNSVTSIGDQAFSGCTSLTSVTSLNPTPPTCDDGSSRSLVFYKVDTQNVTLSVPSGSVSAYKSANTWKDFGSIVGGANISIGSNMSGAGETLIDDVEEPIEYYNLSGVRVQNPDRGVYIKRQGGRATKVVL